MSARTTSVFYRVLQPGRLRMYDGAPLVRLFVEVEVHHTNDRTDDHSQPELSITGVEGPKANGDAYGSCGQCTDSLDQFEVLEPGWTPEMVSTLRDIWDRWHLNAGRAGTIAQTEHLRGLTYPGYPESHFDWAKRELTVAGLQPDTSVDPPYSYGSAWLYEPLPEMTLAWLRDLPESAVNFPWRNDR
jgi:hypothetical protein